MTNVNSLTLLRKLEGQKWQATIHHKKEVLSSHVMFNIKVLYN